MWSGLAKWLVLFLLTRIDWGKGIGQVLASVVGYVQVGTNRTVGAWEVGGDDTSGTPAVTDKNVLLWYSYS